MEKDTIDKCTIYKVIHGSQAYGTSTPNSDLDIRGICVPDKKYFLGFNTKFDQFELKAEEIVIYSIRKYFELATACNPNVIELIFIDDPELVQLETPWSARIKMHRDLFLSMKAKHTFSGYAYAQLKRIQTHKKWLLEPPDHKPTRSEFGLNENDVISFSQLGALNKVVENGGVLETSAMEIVRKENAYRNAAMHYNQYEEWKHERNPKRAALEAKFGYDTKHAMHLVRLLRMGLEILEKGKVIVKRPDAEELLDIRNGAWSFDKIVGYAAEMDTRMQVMYDSGKCAVPHSADKEKLNDVCIDIIEHYWNNSLW